MIHLKRIYVKPSHTGGVRVLVERLWPRGLTKERAAVALWLKDVAPSPQLRKWFGHDPAKWAQFQQRYRQQLRQNDAVPSLKEQGKKETITLMYASRDEEHNGAVVLKKFLQGRQEASEG